MLTGDVLNLYRRKTLDAKIMSAWAEQLVMEGHESDAILIALGNPDLAWEKVNRCFAQICRDLEISLDIDADIETVVRQTWLDEYRKGQRSGAAVLFNFDDIRQQIGFPNQVMATLQEDNPDGTNDSGYCSWDKKMRGEELERTIREHFVRAGILK
jgi:hypothetical protein